MSEQDSPADQAAIPTVAPVDPTPGRIATDRVVEVAIRLSLIAAMAALCYWIVSPFLVPIIWGVIIAVATWPGYRWLLKVTRERRLLASVLFVLLALLLLIVPITMLSGTLVEGARWLSQDFAHGDLKIPPPPDLSAIPLVGADIEAFWDQASTNLSEALRTVEPQLQRIGTWMLSFAADAGVGLLHFVLAILIAAVLLAKSALGKRTVDAVATRLAGARGHQLAHLAEAVVRSVSRGILGVAMIQSLLAGLGMLVAGVPAAGLWALLALILATIQIGVFPVLVPATIYLFYTADTGTAVLFVIWTLIVGSLDNILKPILLGRGVAVPMAVIFIGAIGGFISAGIIGLFVGPVVLVLGYELFLAWLGAGNDPRVEPAHPDANPPRDRRAVTSDSD